MTSRLFACITLASALSLQHGPSVMYHFPQWSPDGTTILVSATLDGDSEIYVLPIYGGPARRLTDNTADDDIAQWTDQGRRILFSSSRRGQMEGFVMNADGTGQRPTDEQPPVPRLADGTRLIEDHADGYGVLVAVRPDGTRRAITTGLHAEQGTYSPDGSRLVYEQRSAAAPDDIPLSNIVIARPDGSAARVVASGTDPSWCPDGTAIVFKTFDRVRRERWIATIAADGTRFERLSTGVHPHWSPDGRRIAFMKENAAGRTDIWIMDRDGRHQRCLTCTPEKQASF